MNPTHVYAAIHFVTGAQLTYPNFFQGLEQMSSNVFYKIIIVCAILQHIFNIR
jgi:hypothetical protein